MSVITATSATTGPGTIAVIIIGVLAFSAALTGYLAWIGQRAMQSAERAEREPRYKRRRLLWKGMTYLACTLLALTLNITGREPKKLLLPLPLGVAFAWFYLSAAIRIKIPPE
jgi:hypothetical protein